MQRRKFLIGMGSLAAGSAAAMGTGAFTSAEADRDLTVSVAEDSNGYLKLSANGKGDNSLFSSIEENTLSLNFGERDLGAGEPDPQGVNPDSVMQFDGVFRISNLGTQSVDVWFETDMDGVTFYRFSDPDENSLNGWENRKEGLGEGAHMTPGIEIDTTGDTSVEDLEGEVTIYARDADQDGPPESEPAE
ncbi:hypothetical protein [Haloarcula montana]|uniref:hypothetical protein n=1 Tax=Haloarcula montana TaxID=3111776 RepID=UPI002D76F94B|nr:hypothetical protein [Haloarcula sp. GH36]